MPVAHKCRGCGYTSAKRWIERCPECGRFFNIRQVNADIPGAEIAEPVDGEVISLSDAIAHVVEVPRIETGIVGIDHVLGGGFAKNSLNLICGDPGCGKTCLILQAFQALAKLHYNTLYVTGEQTVNDLALRAKSFGKFSARMVAVRETDLDTILDIIDDRKPDIVAIDSLQTLFIDDDLEIGGSMSIKIAVRELMKYAKDEGVAIVLVGHVTKGGAIGGPRALEHFVDVNLWLAGNKSDPKRVLRVDSKNRFGETPRQAVFEMTEKGLVEVHEPNPEEKAS